ncbi:unnamed protein product [Peronospora destructor]|uniref:Ion transport domain-containing protein n=1 Tax=Peronospora destructor TaxID=86335 RepID=A0AAV0SZU4_9STRA|nr:unnamed protein product [Peronospora destructor]
MKKTREHRGHSYNENSTLLSSPSPSQWRCITARRHTTVRQDIWTVLRFRSSVQHHTGLQYASYVLELSILTLILLNVVVAISETSAVVVADTTGSSLGPKPIVNDWTDIFLLVSTIIFSIEYMLRLWSCVEDDRFSNGKIIGRLKWMSRPLSLIDLLALVPFYLEVGMEYDAHHDKALTLRSLRLLRIVSFLRLERMYNAMKNLRVVFARKKEEFLVLTYLTAMPNGFPTFSVSLWWSVETITSLGYGDIVPITGMGRVVGASLALWGIVLFTIPGAVLGSSFIEVMLEKQHEEEAELYSMAVDRDDKSCDNPLFVGNFSDEEEYHEHHTEHDHPISAPHTPMSVKSSDSQSTPHVGAALAMHQRLETIVKGQHHMETQLWQQQQQLERLTRLVEAALDATSAASRNNLPH